MELPTGNKPGRIPKPGTWYRLEYDYLKQLLAKYPNETVRGLAFRSGLSRSTFHYKLKQYGLR